MIKRLKTRIKTANIKTNIEKHLEEHVEKHIEKHLGEHIGLFKQVLNWSLNHVFITSLLLYVLIGIPLLISPHLSAVSIVFSMLFVLYIITYAVYRMKTNIDRLLHHELSNRQLIIGYLSFIFFAVFLFSILYFLISISGAGYLRYGDCIDVTRTNALNVGDPNMVRNLFHYPYFSAITFFSVGYGDICPMGWMKIIAVLNSLMGHAFTVLIVALAINNYVYNKRDGK